MEDGNSSVCDAKNLPLEPPQPKFAQGSRALSEGGEQGRVHIFALCDSLVGHHQNFNLSNRKAHLQLHEKSHLDIQYY